MKKDCLTTFSKVDFNTFEPEEDKIRIEDIAHALSMMTRAVADPLLVRALCSAAQELDEPVRVGLYRSHDAFYMESKAAHPGLRERMQKWIDTGVLVVENESGLLFTYGHLLGLRAASICVALGSMFADPNANVYGAYADPEHLARRIETATRIAMRAAELLEGSK